MSATQPPADAVEQRHRERARDWWNNKRGFGGDHLRQLAQAFAAFEATLRPAIIAEERAETVAWLRELNKGDHSHNHWTHIALRLERGEHEQKGPSRG